MTAEQFVYWLQGYMEINDPQTISKTETQIIKDHLKLVFDKETPDRQPHYQEQVDRWKDASKRILQQEAEKITIPNPSPYTSPPQPVTSPDWTWIPHTITYTNNNTNSTSTSNIIC